MQYNDFIKVITDPTKRYVDKSLFIKEIIESGNDPILITAPRRWGKSVNISMLKTFLEIKVDKDGKPINRKETDEYKVFFESYHNLSIRNQNIKVGQDLKTGKPISKPAKDIQGQYPVIYISLSVKGSSYDKIEQGILSQMYKSFQVHDYLLNSDKLKSYQKDEIQKFISKDLSLITTDIKHGLGILSNALHTHFGKRVWVLIDEYDTAISESFLKLEEKDFSNTMDLLGEIFKYGLKENNSLEKGVVTGILRLAKTGLFSTGTNNWTEHSILSGDYNKYYGFSKTEVETLVKEASLSDQIKEVLNEIEQLYNGYTFSNTDEKRYNPFSLANYIRNAFKRSDNEWVSSGTLDNILSNIILQEQLGGNDFNELLARKELKEQIDGQINLKQKNFDKKTLYSILVHSGYLTTKSTEEKGVYKISIPNTEVKEAFEKRIQDWISFEYKVSNPNSYIKILFEEPIENFENKIANTLLNNTSFHDIKNENSYHMLMNGILIGGANGRYTIKSNIESGKGRFDNVIIPRSKEQIDTAIILEYKVAESEDKLEEKAKEAMQQIIHQKYAEPILSQNEHITAVRRIGMAFYKKNVFIYEGRWITLLHK